MAGRTRRILLSRVVIVPAVCAIVVIVWNAYVAAHADGVVTGRVVDRSGQPVADASVRMLEQNFTTNSQRGTTRTDANGRFRFDDNRSHSIQLRAEKEGVGRSDQQAVRLYFRSQHVDLSQPLVLQGAPR
jgi:protocatechuate 3,4-dioxygenase beta subunit